MQHDARPEAACATAVRVFISYAHDDLAHEERVRDFWRFLREQGVDARVDLLAAERRQNWPEWMTQQIRYADFVLVVASPAYKRRAQGDAEPDEGRGVRWEARIIQELLYSDQDAGLQSFLPVVLPGCSPDDIPLWMGPVSTTHYQVSEYTAAGAEKLLRVLTGQPRVIEPDLGLRPFLPPRDDGPSHITGPETGSRVVAGQQRLPDAPPVLLQRIDPEPGSPDSPVNAISWDPDGHRIVIANDSTTVRVYEISGQGPWCQLAVKVGGLPWTRVLGVAFSQDGTLLASAASFPSRPAIMRGPPCGAAAVWDATTGRQLPEILHDRAVTAVAFSPDGTRLATGCADNSARIWNVASRQEMLTFRHHGAVTAVAFSPKGIRLATGSADGSARIWDAANGQHLLGVQPGSAVATVAYGLDGACLATGSADGSARIWDAANGQQLLEVRHDGAVTAVAFSPDDTRFATGSADGSARIWDAANGQHLLGIQPGSAVTTAAFSPDGTRLATGSADGSVWIWAVATLERGSVDQ